jgi:AGCS family alanine or glycine:cation symporter
MVLCVGASFGGGNAFQVGQSLEAIRGDLPLLETMPWLYGIVMAIAVGVVIIGGIKSIGAVAGRIVPLMCLAYVTTAIYILIRNYDAIPAAAGTILQQAFTPDAAYGGFIGVLVIGIKRAVFSNEAGVGSAAIAHSAAKTDEPVSEGIVALLEPFIDTVVVCTITALVVVVTGAYLAPKTDVDSVRFNQGTTELTAQSANGLSGIANVLKNNSHTNVTLRPLSETKLAQQQSGVIRDFLIAADVETNRIVISEFDSESSTESLRDKTGLSVDVAKSQGARITLYAFISGGHDWFRYILYFAVVLFAYSTCISWSYYGERCWVELFGAKTSMIYKILFLIFTVLGSIVTRGNILDFSDLMILGMSFPNLLGVFLLSGIVKRQLNLYWQKYKNNELARADDADSNADSGDH